MEFAIAQFERERAENPNLTHAAFCNTNGLDHAFRTNMCRFMKDPKSLEEGCGSGKNQAHEIVKKSVIDDWNHDITTQYSEEDLFAKVPVKGVSKNRGWVTLLHTLAKKEFGQRVKNSTWSSWLSTKITKPCKAIYDKRAADANEESDDESYAGFDF